MATADGSTQHRAGRTPGHPRVVALALALAAAAVGRAAAAVPARPRVAPEHPHFEATLALDVDAIAYLTSVTEASSLAVGVTQHLWWPPGIDIAFGLRYRRGDYTPDVGAGEGFGSFALAPTFGVWRPRLGVEAGVDSAPRLVPPSDYPRGSDDASRPPPGPVYVGVVASAARFRFGRVLVDALGVGLATTLQAEGSVLRVQVHVFEIGWTL